MFDSIKPFSSGQSWLSSRVLLPTGNLWHDSNKVPNLGRPPLLRECEDLEDCVPSVRGNGGAIPFSAEPRVRNTLSRSLGKTLLLLPASLLELVDFVLLVRTSRTPQSKRAIRPGSHLVEFYPFGKQREAETHKLHLRKSCKLREGLWPLNLRWSLTLCPHRLCGIAASYQTRSEHAFFESLSKAALS